MTQLSIAIVTALLASPLAAERVEEVVAAHLAARGGAERLRGIESLRSVGRVDGVHGGAVRQLVEWRRPSSLRIETTIQGRAMVQAFDGDRGWFLVPFHADPAPRPATADDLAWLARSADLLGPLVDAEAKGIALELAGREPFEGTEAHRIRATYPSGETVELFLDVETCLQIGERGTRKQGYVEARYEATFGDFHEIDGLVMPFYRAVRLEGLPEPQVATIESIELDVELGDERFAMPAAAGGS